MGREEEEEEGREGVCNALRCLCVHQYVQCTGWVCVRMCYPTPAASFLSLPLPDEAILSALDMQLVPDPGQPRGAWDHDFVVLAHTPALLATHAPPQGACLAS